MLGSLNPRDEIDLFGMGVYGDPADPDTNILHLVQGGIGLPDEAYYREDRYEPIRQAYVDTVSTLLRLAGYAEHHADSDAMAKRFLTSRCASRRTIGITWPFGIRRKPTT